MSGQGDMLPIFPDERAEPPIQADDGFAAFWAVYPRHVAKMAAQRAWATATRWTPPDVIVAAAASYAQQCAGKDPKYIAHPATWLNGRRWQDEAAEAAPPKPHGYEWANADPGTAFPCPPEYDWRRFMT